jgi:diguanylate cyclase (GGDEF)-like protein/PAS domain S-box-containing protein
VAGPAHNGKLSVVGRTQSARDEDTDVGMVVATAIDGIPGAAVLVFDRDLRYLMVRGGAVSDNAIRAEELQSQRAPDVMPPDRWDYLRPMYEEALRGGTAMAEVDSADGARHYLIRTAPVRAPSGEVLGGVSVASDVTELRMAQQAQATSERRMRLTFHSAPIGMALEGTDRSFVEVNRALCEMVDRTSQHLLGEGVKGILHPADEELDRAARAQVASGEVDAVTSEVRLVRPDGAVVWVRHSLGLLTDDLGGAQHFVSHYADITDVRQAREAMRYQATRDPMTGLPNRAGFQEGVSSIVAHPPRAGRRLAVLFLDMDDLKTVNDEYGHAAGDRVLVTCARRIRSLLRADDLLARFGGDEFVALLTGIRDPSDARLVSEQVHTVVRAPIPLEDGGEVNVSLSIGVAMVEPGEPAEEAIRRADKGMYRAKESGGGCTVVAVD